jgi:hypothetical protein
MLLFREQSQQGNAGVLQQKMHAWAGAADLQMLMQALLDALKFEVAEHLDSMCMHDSLQHCDVIQAGCSENC